MCGIIGVFSSSPLPNGILNNAINSLKNRGPDGHNIYFSDNHKIALGHTRLKIIGLENGEQPLISPDGNLVAIVNGEFYDYKIIKQQLTQDGFVFKTESDSEIILALYQKYGVNCLDKLNGEFSFLLFDKKKNLFFAARDRFGVKPLFIANINNMLVLGSSIQAILSIIKVKNINYSALNCFYYGVPSQSETYIKNIKQIEPGHYIVYDGKSLIKHCYWDFTYNSTPAEKSDQELIEEFRINLEESIKRRLIADVPIGFYLSGGIDSSGILAIASFYTNQKINAFNIAFEQEEYNENNYAQLVAKHLDVSLSTLQICDQDLADHYSEAVYFREAPVYQTSGVAKFLLSEHTRNHGYKVVLTGEGADEMLLGYPSFREDYILNLPINKKNIFLNSLAEENATTSSAYVSSGEYVNLLKIKKRLGFIPSFLKLSHDISKYSQTIFNIDYAKSKIENNDIITDEILKIYKKDIYPNVNQSAFLYSKTFFPELILSYLGDRMEMAHGVEARLPFLDNNLISLIQKLPIHLKINSSLEGKYILRKAMEPYLPQEICWRKKHIFAAPGFGTKTRSSSIYLLMAEIFRSKKFNDMKIFDQRKTLALLNNSKNFMAREKMLSEFALHLALSTYYLLNS
jgi:asparagine synthase (glutamine-hydrolysing)